MSVRTIDHHQRSVVDWYRRKTHCCEMYTALQGLSLTERELTRIQEWHCLEQRYLPNRVFYNVSPSRSLHRSLHLHPIPRSIVPSLHRPLPPSPARSLARSLPPISIALSLPLSLSFPTLPPSTRGRRNVNKIGNRPTTLASTLLHRLDTQCVQQNIQMLLGQTSDQTFHIHLLIV